MVTPAVLVLVQMTKILAETAGVELMNKLWGDDDGAKVYQELQNLNAEMKQMFDEEFDINNIKDAQKHIHTITHYLNHNIPNYKAPQQDGTVLSNEQIYNQIINVDRFDSEQHVRDAIMSPLEISSIPVAAIDNYILGNNLYIIFCQELAKLDPNNPTWAGKVSEQAKTAPRSEKVSC